MYTYTVTHFTDISLSQSKSKDLRNARTPPTLSQSVITSTTTVFEI